MPPPDLPKRAAPVDHPIHPLLQSRYSGLAFEPRDVPAGDLQALFEAARWAPSCFNEQPWRFLVAPRSERAEFDDLLACLVEGNRTFAAQAGVLLIGMVSRRFARNGQENAHARHDLGLAMGALTLEATSRGLIVHQMGGIQAPLIRDRFQVPDDLDIVTATAIGYPGDPASLPDALRAREAAPRTRRPLTDFVFGSKIGTPARFLST